ALPRAPALDVVGHPLFRGPADRRHWDLLARSLRIGRGDDSSRLDAHARRGFRIAAGRETADDRRSIVVPPAAVRALRAAIRRVRHALPAADAGWGGHATAHLETLRRCFRLDMLLDEEAQVVEAVRDVLATLAGLDALGETIPRAAFVEAFERECRRRRLGAPAPRGVAVLDANAARAPARRARRLGRARRVRLRRPRLRSGAGVPRGARRRARGERVRGTRGAARARVDGPLDRPPVADPPRALRHLPVPLLRRGGPENPPRRRRRRRGRPEPPRDRQAHAFAARAPLRKAGGAGPPPRSPGSGARASHDRRRGGIRAPGAPAAPWCPPGAVCGDRARRRGLRGLRPRD